MAIKQACELCRAKPETDFGSGATEAEITTAETRLGVRLVGQYRDFLIEIGWAEIGGEGVNGLGAGVPTWLDLIAETLGERTEFRPFIPPYLLPIHNDGAGNHHCLDLRGGDGVEPTVVFWNHEIDETQTPEPIVDCFLTWFVFMLEDPGLLWEGYYTLAERAAAT